MTKLTWRKYVRTFLVYIRIRQKVDCKRTPLIIVMVVESSLSVWMDVSSASMYAMEKRIATVERTKKTVSNMSICLKKKLDSRFTLLYIFIIELRQRYLCIPITILLKFRFKTQYQKDIRRIWRLLKLRVPRHVQKCVCKLNVAPAHPSHTTLKERSVLWLTGRIYRDIQTFVNILFGCKLWLSWS